MKLITALYITLLSFNGYAAGTSNELYVGGTYYKKILSLKDLIADVLPPPAFIVEAYSSTLEMIEEMERAMADKKIDSKEMQTFEGKIEKLRLLKEGVSGNDEIEGYLERIKIWSKDLSDIDNEEKTIKDLVTKKALDPAISFFSVAQNKLIPALKKGNIAEAKQIQTELRELYLAHRVFIENAVIVTRERIQEIETLSSKASIPDNKIVKGKNYTKILLLKDLISDILPPPGFIIESQLINFEMYYAVEKHGPQSPFFFALKTKAVELEKNYQKRHQFWRARLNYVNLRQILLEDSHRVVTKFFNEQQSAFLPALEKNNLIQARKQLNEKLSPLFLEHKALVSKLIAKADNHMIMLEKEIASKVNEK